MINNRLKNKQTSFQHIRCLYLWLPNLTHPTHESRRDESSGSTHGINMLISFFIPRFPFFMHKICKDFVHKKGEAGVLFLDFIMDTPCYLNFRSCGTNMTGMLCHFWTVSRSFYGSNTQSSSSSSWLRLKINHELLYKTRPTYFRFICVHSRP